MSGADGARGKDRVRVMIVDDSLTVRTIFKRMVESDRHLEVVGTASSAERAIAQLVDTPADVILLDLEMPGMGGLEALPTLLRTSENTEILVVSALTEDGAEATMAALSMGAADTMLKPRPGGFNEDYRAQLLAKISALGGATVERSDADIPSASTGGSEPDPVHMGKRPEVIAIGASTGGIHALGQVLQALPPAFDLPILITQHLPPSFVPVFARQIENTCARRTIVAQSGTEIRRGEIVIAPGEGHLEVQRVGDRLLARISVEPTSSGCTPSVDPMLSSLAEACNGHVLAVILSGMGRDGLEGASVLADRGGTIYAQDADTSAVWGMPGAVAKAGLTSLVAPPDKIAAAILSLTPALAAK